MKNNCEFVDVEELSEHQMRKPIYPSKHWVVEIEHYARANDHQKNVVNVGGDDDDGVVVDDVKYDEIDDGHSHQQPTYRPDLPSF